MKEGLVEWATVDTHSFTIKDCLKYISKEEYRTIDIQINELEEDSILHNLHTEDAKAQKRSEENQEDQFCLMQLTIGQNAIVYSLGKGDPESNSNFCYEVALIGNINDFDKNPIVYATTGF